MKKLLPIFLLFVLVGFTGCSSNGIAYSEKANYLPIISESSLISDTTKDDGVIELVYQSDKVSIEEALNEYKDIFESDGWTIDKESSEDSSLEASKDGHYTIVVFSQPKEEVQYTIETK